jgi:hypothetical protein
MNREIKFRGKRTDNKEWVYEYYFTTPLTAEYNIPPENGAYFDCMIKVRRHVISNCNGCVFEVIPETVGQFVCRTKNTSMYVENSNELYEGDIINRKGSDTNYQVLYGNNDFYAISTEEDEYGPYCYGALRQCVVIGNIHDNPELLTIK